MQQNIPFHILLADDDHDDTFLFQEALNQIPVVTRLDTVDDGMKLIKTLESLLIAPNLIFLDMNMPIKNGLECLSEIRKFDKFKDIPVIMLSTSVATYLLEDAYQSGASLYIQKPTNFSSLVAVIEKSLTLKVNPKSTSIPEQFLIKNNTI